MYDRFVAGSEDQIRTTLDILANEGAKRGLYLTKHKCELWSIVDLPSVDREVTRNTGNHFKVLGAAVGSPEIVSSWLQKRVQKVVSLLENLSNLDDLQSALGLFRFCLGTPKLVYSLCTNTPTRDLIDVLKAFNSSQWAALDQIIGTLTCDNEWKQSTLPINISGLGVRQSQEQYTAAYVGSVLASNDLVQKIPNQHVSDNGVFRVPYTSLDSFNLNSYTQKKIQEAVDTKKFSELQRNQSPNRKKSKTAITLPQSRAWLAAPAVPAFGLYLSQWISN